jgi:hypothetical protein
LQAGGNGKLRIPIESARAARLEIGARVEVRVVDLGGQVRAKWRRIEAGDQADGRFATRDARPQSIDPAADGRERADAGNDDAVTLCLERFQARSSAWSIWRSRRSNSR